MVEAHGHIWSPQQSTFYCKHQITMCEFIFENCQFAFHLQCSCTTRKRNYFFFEMKICFKQHCVWQLNCSVCLPNQVLITTMDVKQFRVSPALLCVGGGPVSPVSSTRIGPRLAHFTLISSFKLEVVESSLHKSCLDAPRCCCCRSSAI